MVHAKINLSRMFDWIEQCLDADKPAPDDAAIMARFGFDSPESARTLLAELADAGRISIKGYGSTRTITLGRSKSTLAAAPRPTPAVRKADPAVDECAAKITAIVARGQTAGAARAVVAASALKAFAAKPAPKPARAAAPIVTPAPAPSKKEAQPMPAKSIQLPASAVRAIEAVEEHAKRLDVSIGMAAASLIERALTAPTEVPVPPTIATIMADLNTVFMDLAARADRPYQSDEVAELTTRAETAERRLAALRSALEA